MSDNPWPSQTAAQAPAPAPVETPEELAARRTKEIQDWLAALPVVKQWVEHERTLRDTVTATCFPTPKKGTQRFELGGGYKLKLVHGFSYTLGDKDKEDADGNKIGVDVQTQEIEDKIAALGPEGKVIVERLIRWKPELSGSEYEKLSKDIPVEAAAKAIIDTILTVKPAAPQLVFEAPKPPAS